MYDDTQLWNIVSHNAIFFTLKMKGQVNHNALWDTMFHNWSPEYFMQTEHSGNSNRVEWYSNLNESTAEKTAFLESLFKLNLQALDNFGFLSLTLI